MTLFNFFNCSRFRTIYSSSSFNLLNFIEENVKSFFISCVYFKQVFLTFGKSRFELVFVNIQVVKIFFAFKNPLGCALLILKFKLK